MGCSKRLSNSLATKQETRLPKSVLVQLALEKNVPLPTYNFTKEGDAHCPTFIATVQINGACYSGGPAKSKKEAARKSACEAIRAIEPQYCECLCTKKQTVSILLSFS
jgi:dsRNA-specific ribonuclease